MLTPELAALFASGEAPPRLLEVVEQGTAIVPLGRPGEPAEVAATVAFLAGARQRIHHRTDHLRQRRRQHGLTPNHLPTFED